MFVPGQFPDAAGAGGADVEGAHGVAGTEADSLLTRGGVQGMDQGLGCTRSFLMAVPKCAKEGTQQQEFLGVPSDPEQPEV